MAQERKRGNRETKKPKKVKPKVLAEAAPEKHAGPLSILLKKKK